MYADKKSLRIKNTEIVLNTIIQNQPISRIAITEITGLNKASVSEITRKLIDNHVIKEIGSGESTDLGGRRPILLVFNHTSGLSLGIDVGVNTTRYHLTYLNGDLVEDGLFDTHLSTLSEDLSRVIDASIARASKTLFTLVGVTISVQGVVDDNHIIFTPNYNIIDLEQLQADYQVPIYFENEANLAAIANAHHFNEENSATLTLRTGIGTGILFENELYLGQDGGAGELGHTVVFAYGRKCPCGNHGCLERYASEKAILEDYQALKNDSQLTLDDLVNNYISEETEAVNIIKECCQYLAIGLTNFLTLYATPKIYLVSTLVEQIPDFIELIKPNMTSIFTHHKEILKSPYGKFASCHGASIYTNYKFRDTIAHMD